MRLRGSRGAARAREGVHKAQYSCSLLNPLPSSLRTRPSSGQRPCRLRPPPTSTLSRVPAPCPCQPRSSHFAYSVPSARMPFLPSWPPQPCSSLWTPSGDASQGSTSQSTLTPQAQSFPSSAGPEDAFLSLPPPRQGRTTVPVWCAHSLRSQTPSPAAIARLAPGVAPETRGVQGALQGVGQSVPRTAVANDHTLSVHGTAQTDMVVEVRNPTWILPDKHRGVPRAGPFWSFWRRSCFLVSPASGGARRPWLVAVWQSSCL